MARKEVQVLAEMMDKTRQLTRFYISKLKEIDPYAKVQSGDMHFNSLYWLTAHMLWAEDNLIVVATGGKSLAPEWISHYRIGADGSLHEGHGDYKALLDEMKAHHERAMAYLAAMNDEDLDQDNLFGFSFGDGDKSKRLVIMHAIRHEGTHIGNLAWMAKMSAVKTV
jgi:uncharacterized damage-inducible protein DinB